MTNAPVLKSCYDKLLATTKLTGDIAQSRPNVAAWQRIAKA